MESKQVNKDLRKHVPIDPGMHKLAKIKAAKRSMSIKDLVEGYIADGLEKDKGYE